ncbi:MAG TPA: prolyl oligopeptidase family serine peptidase [Vicinamibacterales bacterium]|nr:prolyl oligopeptidase family serine peptidase [Vicinamibacterales bacterium]
MLKHFARIGLTALACVATHAGLNAQSYQLPPKVIVDILDTAPTPTVVLSPNRQAIALLERRSMPTIADLAEPIYRLAGARINPKTNGRQQRLGAGVGITLKPVAAGAERKIALPAGANVGALQFSPDGKYVSFTNTKGNAIELWVADIATGQPRLVTGTDRLNASAGEPCDWFEDSVTVVCTTVPANRGPAPSEPRVPSGPNVHENYGKAAPAPTLEDMLKTKYDEDLFEYYFTSQVVTYDIPTSRKTLVGKPAIVENISTSPNGEYLLVAKAKRPFSHLYAMSGFPKDVEIWTRRGEVARKVADVPTSEGIPINGVQVGPRLYRWRQDQPATITWVEALDEGNPKNKVPFRDRVVTLSAPFTAGPTELGKTEWRYGGVSFTEKGVALLTENERVSRKTRTWILDGGAPRKLWDRKQQDAYSDPGTPVTRRTGGPIIQNGDAIWLSGSGATPQGDRPFLSTLNLKTLQTERVFRADDETYETVVAPLDDAGKRILTRYETPSDPPNYYVRDLAAGTKRAVTSFKDPAPQLRGVQKQFVTYKRKDGVSLSATLYLPQDYKAGQRLPVLMWAYPREFGDADVAGQVTGSPYRFTTYTGASHLFLLTQGYAIFDDPKMPIVGEGETANDQYVQQLTMSAEAAVDKVVEMGVGDRDRIGVGGHSYGAFMTANLLAHTDLFRAGVARSGAYNRTLTPFGFQSETRTFWEIPEIYGKMSPFFHASKINEPILLIHGEMDDNSGTFPIQSERLWMALKGFGATVRYVTLPYEAHGYVARESVLHTIAETINWLDKYVKNAPPRVKTTTATAK